MAVVTPTVLKGYFEKGKVPTEGNYVDLIDTLGGSGGIPGAIILWAGSPSTPPTGYLVCDGSAVSRTTYADLFTAIGTTYGVGDGSTTFNLPNFKGRVPVGQDSGQTEFDGLGETGGSKTQTLSEANLPAHRHTIEYSTGPGGDNSRHITGVTQGGGYAGNDTNDILTTGSGTAHNNLQPYLVLNYLIKT